MQIFHFQQKKREIAGLKPYTAYIIFTLYSGKKLNSHKIWMSKPEEWRSNFLPFTFLFLASSSSFSIIYTRFLSLYHYPFFDTEFLRLRNKKTTTKCCLETFMLLWCSHSYQTYLHSKWRCMLWRMKRQIYIANYWLMYQTNFQREQTKRLYGKYMWGKMVENKKNDSVRNVRNQDNI